MSRPALPHYSPKVQYSSNTVRTSHTEDLSLSELEELLAKHRLQEELTQLQNPVTTSGLMLHQIAKLSEDKGEPLPQLVRNMAHLYGKDGSGGGRELVITAQVNLTIEVDGESLSVPVLVQPNRVFWG